MSNYCLMASGVVVNMASVPAGREPSLSDWQRAQGLTWVPLEKVPMAALREYRYWSERP